MLSLELLQQLHLLLLVATGTAHFLLSLIIHHLLNHSTSLAIQITQTRILRRDLGHINLRRSSNNMRPPLNLVDLIEVNIDFLAGRGGGSLKSPRGFVDEDSVGEVALKQEMINKISRRSFIGGPISHMVSPIFGVTG
jgi:hypothetical protein